MYFLQMYSIFQKTRYMHTDSVAESVTLEADLSMIVKLLATAY